MATSSLSVRHSRSLLRLTTAAPSVAHPPPTICSRRHLHISATRAATPLPHPTVPGPPPDAPQASITHTPDRVARKRQQAEAQRSSQQAQVQPSRPATALQKRFWRDVAVREAAEGGLEVHLDKRPVRTAARETLRLPPGKRALAAAIALEWDQLVSAQQALKHHYIPLTSLASRALDVERADAAHGPANEVRDSIVRLLMRYLGTDTLLCWAPEKNIHEQFNMDSGVKSLRQRQREVAEPIIAFLTMHCFPGVEIVPTLSEDSIFPTAQPEVTLSVIRGWITGLPAWDLTALERGVLATKSFLVAARLLVEWSPHFAHLRGASSASSDDGSVEIVAERFGIDHAAEAANLEVLHQTEQWGEVEDTHDVEKEDLRRQLGSVILLVS